MRWPDSVRRTLAGRPRAVRLVLAALAAVTVASAAGLAWAPWLAAGAILGAALVAVSVAWPAAVVTVLLFLGPLDLAFLTGGFKELFASLGGLDMNGIRLLAVSAGLGLAILADPAQRERLTSPPVRWYVVFLAWAALSVAWSGDRMEGLRLLFKLAWPLLIYLTVSAPGRTRADVESMADWVLAGGALLVVLNPLFVLTGNVVVEVSGDVRVGGAGVHQNPFSFYLLVVVLLSLGRFATRAQWRYVVLAAGAIVWMALTLTRITMLAGFVALAGAGLYGMLARRSLRPALVAVGLGALIGVALLPVVLERTFGYVPTVAELLALARDPVGLFLRVNWQGRELFWGILVAAWAASPWLGLGLGSSSGILKALFPREAGTVAHNEYIRLGTDTGVLGIALFSVAALVWVREVMRTPLAPAARGDAGLQEVALPALAVMLAWGVISLTDNAFDYYAPFTQFAGFLAGGVAVYAREGVRAPAAEEARPSSNSDPR
ncbi:MAG: hypothetical protein ACYC6F_08455 [Longimicrobiales bacterium]